jgi:molybdate transport system permease protein
VSLLLRADLSKFRSYICCEDVSDALHLTLVTSLTSAFLIVLIGTPLAYWLTFSRFRGKRIIDSIIDLPIVLPPAVAGVALLMAFGREGLIGRFLNEDMNMLVSNGTTAAVVIAQVFVACPFYIRQARIGFQGVPPQLILASRTLGASPGRTLARVVFPLSWHALVAGLITSWARAVGEFGATMMFAGNFRGATQTMPLAIYQTFNETKIEAMIVLSLTLVVVSFAVMVLTKVLLSSERHSQEPSFALVD